MSRERLKEVWCYRPLCIMAARSTSVQQQQCPMCSFECPSIAILLSHLRLVHSNDPRFLVCCGINSCTVTSRSFSSLYTHIYRHHPGAGIKRRSASSLSMEVPTVSESESHEDTFQCCETGIHEQLHISMTV